MKSIEEMTNFEIRRELMFGDRNKIIELASHNDRDFRRVEGILNKINR